jgi:hypothetical protein
LARLLTAPSTHAPYRPVADGYAAGGRTPDARPARDDGAAVDPRPPRTQAERELRATAALFEAIQGERVSAGERLRAVLQGRSGAPRYSPDGGERGAPRYSADEVAQILRDAHAGRSCGPVPLLGRALRQQAVFERAALAALETLVAQHPAWPWLSRVRGIGATLAGRLVARLRVGRAPHASSFWAYCGLATVAAVEYRCDRCGAAVTMAATRRPRAAHRHALGGGACDALMRAAPPSGTDVTRRKQVLLGATGRPTFDPGARLVCHLIGVSMLRRGDSYRAYYDEARAHLAVARPAWPRGRQHLTALRKTEKLFLAHLWSVWREAEGLTATPHPALAAGSAPSAWAMVA